MFALQSKEETSDTEVMIFSNFVLMSSPSGSARMRFVNRDFNASRQYRRPCGAEDETPRADVSERCGDLWCSKRRR